MGNGRRSPTKNIRNPFTDGKELLREWKTKRFYEVRVEIKRDGISILGGEEGPQDLIRQIVSFKHTMYMNNDDPIVTEIRENCLYSL